MSTRAELKQRIRDYMATYADAFLMGTDVTDAEPLNRLPAFEVEFYGTTRRRSGRRNVCTYSVRVYVYACEARDVNDDAKWRADRATAEAMIDPLAEFIADNPTLKLDTGSPVVMLSNNSVLNVNDAGVGLLNMHQKAYAGFALEFQITQ